MHSDHATDEATTTAVLDARLQTIRATDLKALAGPGDARRTFDNGFDNGFDNSYQSPLSDDH